MKGTVEKQSISYWRFIFFILISMCIGDLKLYAATMVFETDFESGSISGLSCSGNCPTVATSPVASGKYSGNFDLTRSMAVPYRTEVVFTNANELVFGQEYWFGFSYRYTDWASDISGEMAPFQVHERTQDWDPTCAYGSAYSNAPFYMFSGSDRVSLNRFGGKSMWSMAIPKNQWINITLHFKISAGSDGYIELWKDGVQVATYNGPNAHSVDKCGRPMRSPYMKMGIYKWEWKEGRPATQSSRRQFFLDNIKLAKGADGYSLVSSIPTPPPDTTAPSISNIVAAMTDTTATISWTTNEASDSVVQYGATTTYGLSASGASLVTSHKLILQNLKPSSLYHYKISSKDSSGNNGSSADLTFTTKASAVSLVSDSFNTTQLNTTLWKFYDPVANSKVAANGSQIAISVPAGSSHDLYTGDLTAPRVRQASQNTDFRIETKMDSAVLKKYQIQGLTVEQDNNNLVRFDVFSDGSRTHLHVGSVSGGSFTLRLNMSIPNSKPIYLRIVRVGSQFTFYYSTNGTSFSQVYQMNHALSVSNVGLFAGNAGSNPPAFTGLFDYFRVY